MQLLVDFLPILIFFGAYFYEGIYFATAVLMAVMPVVMLGQWIVTRKLNRVYAASTALVLVLGSATLLLRNPLFLYWKPTVLYWAIGLAYLGSQFIGDKVFIERLLGGAAELTKQQWRSLNQAWVAFFLIIGGINIYVAYAYSEATWVKFKLFGMLGLMLAFIIGQSIWLVLAMNKNESTESEPES
jgi:intracellular septation protein